MERQYIKSDFQFDYSKLETLPTQFVENLNIFDKRRKDMEKVDRIFKQIEDLKYALEAESHYISTELLRQNTFPRFNGYNDFVQDSSDPHLTPKGVKTFFNLAKEVNYINDYSEKEAKKLLVEFQFRLDSFIWLFFQGGGVVKTEHIADYVGMQHVSSSYNDTYPPEAEYEFNVINSDNGKTYRVKFTFYDISKALDFEYMKQSEYYKEHYGIIKSTPAFEMVRRVGFGSINVSVSEILRSKRNGFADDTLGDALYIRSFDPIEIAAFINKTVTEGISETKQEEEPVNNEQLH